MRRFLPTALVAGLVIAAAVIALPALAGEPETVSITVTSTVPGRELRFKGAYAFAEGTLQLVEETTPFEVTGGGKLALGVFERLGDGPDLAVELRLLTGDPYNSRADATGDRVFVGNRVNNIHGGVSARTW